MSCKNMELDPGQTHQFVASMVQLKSYSYGLVLPVACLLGIVGNLLNILVLTRRNMIGPGYCYMRGYAVSSLLGVAVAVPFSLNMLTQRDSAYSEHYLSAFYYARLDLFLCNGLIGLASLLLVALTIERYISVCHPVRAHNQSKSSSRVWFVLLLMSAATALFFLPFAFQMQVVECPAANNTTHYLITEHTTFTHSIYYLVHMWLFNIIYKIAPTILITYLNTLIYFRYRKVCRRRFADLHTNHDSKLHNQSKHRLMMLLVSTAVLFFICNLPMVVLSVTFNTSLKSSYSFQVFRAVANVMEIINYSGSFYIYCLFTKEFRDAFLRMIRCRRMRRPRASIISRTQAQTTTLQLNTTMQ